MPGSPTARPALSRPSINALHGDLVASGFTTIAIRSPFTGNVLHDLPRSTTADVADAFSRARVAQRAWASAGWADRRAVLLRAHDILLERRDQLLDLLQTETGKTRGQALEEVVIAAGVTRYYAVTARDTLRTRRRRGGFPLLIRARVGYRPKGVVGVITPWNYPLSLAVMDAIPALAAGNAVVNKADDQGALSILAVRRAFVDAGVPEALWAVVAGDGEEIGNAVVDTADYVCFTGSTATGRRVAGRAGLRLAGASLELGGKNPMIVLDDVDPESAAADAAYGCFSSMGQLCVSIERIFVLRPVAPAFLDAFTRRTAALVQGPALDWSTDVGSLTVPSQLERVQAHIADAVQRGATILTGGRPRPDIGPLFFEPTVLTDLTDDMECVTEETFGPVVGVTVVDSVEEAIRGANAGPYGLNASVLSGSVARARKVANALDAGSVNINEGYRATFGSVDAPMGGMKQSGLGRRNGPEGLLRFVDSRTVAESTGVMTLPHTGPEFEARRTLLIALLVVLKALRRR